ncbi:B-cell linker protein isoform X2 [Falco biarmicus]|uniref:B-cell linker protein isoform X2 n=1 Tax=Falco rusticolus TaxID=120794 RepID=UPI00188695E5|nr:B-cell linker protein isoform X2 [Falco rusticolus]XP_055577261.1 B-cell linker protein isoform X2 [Falco cherrug]XP_056208681.1 B-cell linker protein isoform X2 [Falco biarmicus]
MATKLPSQEEFENWTAFQVADLLRQFGMPESAVVVEKLGMNGSRFLNVSDYELSRFKIMHQLKLQKMVHDIKKNESGIINKFKKFQNEQVALICKTGKDTWDRLKKKPPPSLPQRDYASEHADNEEEWSDDFDSDYENPDDHSDSEMYVVPSEENPDDSYEPPPSEQEKKKIPSSFPISRGEYADNRTSHQQLPPVNKPLPSTPSAATSRPKKPSVPSLPLPSPAAKPKVPPKPKECSDDEDNYIVPVDNDDDNYIEPTESSMSLPKKPPVSRFMKTAKSAPPTSSKLPLTSDVQEVYEVPEEEEKPSPPPPVTRFTKPLLSVPVQNTEQSHIHSMTRESPKLDTSRNILPLPRNRLHPKADHEVNNNDENHSSNTQESRFPAGVVPSPLPRGLKKTSNAVNSPKPCLPSREALSANEEKPTAAERRRGSSQELPLPPLPSIQKSLLQKSSILPKVPEAANRSLGTSPHSSVSSTSSMADQDAGVHSKAWYAATCDRKTAEDALYRSNKDGSFLIRKSSGQDSRQPYTLVVFYNRRVYNIPIRFIESTRQYALGREKSGEERFDSVAEIVENHQRTSLVLIDSQNNTKDSTKLKHIVRVS